MLDMNELMNNLNRKSNLVFVHMLNILNITFNGLNICMHVRTCYIARLKIIKKSRKYSFYLLISIL